MTCTKRNCPECASVVHTRQEKPAAEPTWETTGPSTHYEDDGPARSGFHYTD